MALTCVCQRHKGLLLRPPWLLQDDRTFGSDLFVLVPAIVRDSRRFFPISARSGSLNFQTTLHPLDNATTAGPGTSSSYHAQPLLTTTPEPISHLQGISKSITRARCKHFLIRKVEAVRLAKFAAAVPCVWLHITAYRRLFYRSTRACLT